jgi:hypothetical protein
MPYSSRTIASRIPPKTSSNGPMGYSAAGFCGNGTMSADCLPSV